MAVLCAGAPTLPVEAGSPATLRVIPGKVTIGGTANIVGSHLAARTYYTLLIAVPNASKPQERYLIPHLAQVDVVGNLHLRVRIPILTHCGNASLYAYTARSKTLVRAAFTLTGCHAGAHVSAPPPPPAPRTHKKP